MLKKISIKPLSVNQCWQGRRFKTKAYKEYEKELMFLLPPLKVDKKNQLWIKIFVGYSNKASDIDNFLKPFLDILQKKYGFNDNKIYALQVYKIDVKKGNESIEFEIGY